jgi:hypothetical protein
MNVLLVWYLGDFVDDPKVLCGVFSTLNKAIDYIETKTKFTAHCGYVIETESVQ